MTITFDPRERGGALADHQLADAARELAREIASWIDDTMNVCMGEAEFERAVDRIDAALTEQRRLTLAECLRAVDNYAVVDTKASKDIGDAIRRMKDSL